MKYSFEVRSKLILDADEEANMSKHVETQIVFIPSKDLDYTKYAKPKGGYHFIGHEAITMALIQGLVANIGMAHQDNEWDSAKHLRFIISELERGFIEPGTVKHEEHERKD